MIETKTYSKMLYAIADECRASGVDLVRISPEAFDEAAERLDAQTVTIRGMEVRLDELAAAMRDIFPAAHRLALELECLLLDSKDTAAVSKCWDSAHEALEQWREFCREDDAARNGVGLAIQQRDELARLRQQLAATRLALVQFGAHDGACSVGDLDGEERHCACDCGYDAAVKAAEDKTHNAI